MGKWRNDLIKQSLENIEEKDFLAFQRMLTTLIDDDEESLILIYDVYISLFKKYPSCDFTPFLDLHQNFHGKISETSVDFIFNLINDLRSRWKTKLLILEGFITHLNAGVISMFSEKFIDFYENNHTKISFYNIIIELSNYFEKLFNIKKKMHFLEYFIEDYPSLYLELINYYINNDNDEKALIVLNKVKIENLSLNEKKQYIRCKGLLYQKMGSTKMYIKSLSELFLIGEFDVYEELSKTMSKRDFKATMKFILNNLNINKDSNIHYLHNLLVKEMDIDNLIKYYDYWNKETIFEDIQYFKLLDINKGLLLYKEYLLKEAINLKPYKIKTFISHLQELKKEDINFQDFLDKLSKIIDNNSYNEIIKYL